MLIKLTVVFLFLSFGLVLGWRSNKKVVCYWGTWSTYRPEGETFGAEDINPHLCTHIIYTFLGIDANASLVILDEWNDVTLGGFNKTVALKKQNPKLKTLVSLGGWKEGSVTYSEVAANATLRAVFINNVVTFLKTYGFDGLDWDWEFPAQRGGSPEDKTNFVVWLKEFRAEFDRHGYILTAAVGPTASFIKKSYDVPALSQYLDLIYLMTYNLNTPFEKVTGQNSPLYPSSHEVTEDQLERNVDACVHAWLRNGAAREKLILGIPIYGQAFTLEDPSNTALGSPASAGKSGSYSYYGICEQLQTGNWTVEWNNEQQVPFAYSGDQWIGYDDVRSVEIKVNYINQLQLGGAMVWAIDLDDFNGRCGPKNPILSTINATLK